MTSIVPPPNLSSSSSSSSELFGGSINFAPYSLSPITASGNESVGSALSGGLSGSLPWWVWAGAVGGAYWLAKRGRK